MKRACLFFLLWVTREALAVTLPVFADEPSIQVVVLIDASGTYRLRQADAIERTLALLDSIAAGVIEARRVHRWEKAPLPSNDRVTIISIDAAPDLMFTGHFNTLKKIDRSAWAARFRARGDYAMCTDVGAAFHLAVRYLDGDPRYVDKYLFAFTDLVDEPPTSSLRKCRHRLWPSPPPDNFPWKALKDVSVTAFWVPVEQILAWRSTIADRGLESTFAIHSESESSAMSVAPPPRPQRTKLDAERGVVAEAERLNRRERFVEKIGKGLWTLGIVGAIGVILIILMVIRQNRAGNRATTVAKRPQISVPPHSNGHL